MKAAQLYEAAWLLKHHDIDPHKSINYTMYTSGKAKLRFMDRDSVIHYYIIDADGKSEKEEVGV